MNEPKVSMIVASYRPNLRKMLLTLKSILLQRDCDYEIIVADDGSKENYFSEIKNLFHDCNFHQYKLITTTENQGTVLNIWNGLKEASGTYIRLISPGDFMHGFYALHNWADFMDNRPDISFSFCESIYYHFEGNDILPTHEYARPQDVNAYINGESLRPYLLADDVCIGAGLMTKTDVLKKYYPLMLHKIQYAEDAIYRIILYAGGKTTYYNAPAVLYEYGTGISTSGNLEWYKKINKDLKTGRGIMLSMTPSDEAKRYHIKKLLTLRDAGDWKNKWKFRFGRLRVYPRSLICSIRRRVAVRRTSCDLDMIFVKELLR